MTDKAHEFTKLSLTPPDVTFEDSLTVYLGDRQIQLLYYGPAHTRGDIVVYLPKERTIYAGDLAFHHVNPVAAEGYVSSWIEVMQKVLRLDAGIVVPGHGPLGTKENFSQLRRYFRTLKRECRRRYNRGMSAEETAQDIRIGGVRRVVEKGAVPNDCTVPIYGVPRGNSLGSACILSSRFALFG